MKNEHYITIMGFMRNELNLKGNELMVYALIYGFSQDDESDFTGSIAYIAEWIGSTKQTVHNILKSLSDKELINKTESYRNGIKFCSYKSVLPVVKNFDGGWSKNLTGGGQKIRPNNIDNINNKNNKNSISCPPSIEEVKEYCNERKNHIDPEAFIDYYAQQGWKLANGNPMKDWQAAVRTWEKRNRKEEKKPQERSWRLKEYKSERKQNTVSMPDEMRNKVNQLKKGVQV